MERLEGWGRSFFLHTIRHSFISTANNTRGHGSHFYLSVVQAPMILTNSRFVPHLHAAGVFAF